MFANVAGLVLVKTEAGKQVNVKLADRYAEGTYDALGAIRPWRFRTDTPKRRSSP